jgi:hypothetical protein
MTLRERWENREWGISNIGIRMTDAERDKDFQSEAAQYCTVPHQDCSKCSLVNYGLDCHNNHISSLKTAAAAMGRKGGSAKSERKTASSRENGRKGGRPKKIFLSVADEEMYRHIQGKGEKYDEYFLKADGEMVYLPRRGRGYTLAPKAVKP